MFSKNDKQRRRSGRSQSSQFRVGNATPSRSQRAEAYSRALDSKRQESMAKKMRRHRLRLKLYLLLAFLGVCLFALSARLTSASVGGMPQLYASDKSSYEKIASSLISKNSFFNQSWSLDKERYKNDIKAEFPEVSAVNVKSRIPFSGKIQLIFSFRQPLFVWKDSGGEVRFIDKSGVVFNKNLTKVNGDKLITILDDSGLVFKSGSTALSQKTTEIIGDLPAQLKSLYPAGISKVTIPVSVREIRVFPKNKNYYIKFSTERELNSQVGELTTLMKYLNNKDTVKQYIDVRLEKKAYYK
jgi:hypothetical protein